jgi:anti-anti-sigma factor
MSEPAAPGGPGPSPAEHGFVVVVLAGELGIAAAPALREELVSLLRPVATQLILDLSAVEHADVSGLAVLVGAGRRAALRGGSLRVAAPSAEVAGLLSATGMGQHLDIFPTVLAAITGWRPVTSGSSPRPSRPATAGATPASAASARLPFLRRAQDQALQAVP